MLARTGTAQPFEVVITHGEDKIEALEIKLGNASRPLPGKVVAAPPRCAQSPGIGWITDMVAVRRGRLEMEICFKP